jgi:hypothetical protein
LTYLEVSIYLLMGIDWLVSLIHVICSFTVTRHLLRLAICLFKVPRQLVGLVIFSSMV